jgi:hypothetical protein
MVLLLLGMRVRRRFLTGRLALRAKEGDGSLEVLE